MEFGILIPAIPLPEKSQKECGLINPAKIHGILAGFIRPSMGKLGHPWENPDQVIFWERYGLENFCF